MSPTIFFVLFVLLVPLVVKHFAYTAGRVCPEFP